MPLIIPDIDALAFTTRELPAALSGHDHTERVALHGYYNAAVLMGLNRDAATKRVLHQFAAMNKRATRPVAKPPANAAPIERRRAVLRKRIEQR